MGRHVRSTEPVGAEPVGTPSGSATSATGARTTTGATPQDHHRLSRLLAFRPIRVTDDKVLAAAAEVVMRDPAQEERTDKRRMLCVAVLLMRDTETHGDIDTDRAFRRTNVDLHVRAEYAGYERKTVETYRADLYRYGRRIHPVEYPSRAKQPGRVCVQEPYSAVEVTRFWTYAQTLPPMTGVRMQIMLALAAGAGARPEEMSQLRTEDVSVTRHDVEVRLTSRRHGGSRVVPVVGADAVAAIRARVATGSVDFMVPGRDRRNAGSRLNSLLRGQGRTVTINPRRLRHFWIVQLAGTCIPTALLLSLADLGDSHTLHELRPFMRSFEQREVRAWMKEVGA